MKLTSTANRYEECEATAVDAVQCSTICRMTSELYQVHPDRSTNRSRGSVRSRKCAFVTRRRRSDTSCVREAYSAR